MRSTGEGASPSPAAGAAPKATPIAHVQQAGFFDDLSACLGGASIPGWLMGILGVPCAFLGPACAAAVGLYYGNAVLTCLGF
ncbi:hypothetical protein CU254_12685 [Amycolatopsis sp. AA4]|uniref:hypothetical protein n=1 Tax=Actinomycetes TaxID=1760 RepID=UPI0001B5655F|nr:MULTISPECIES: hypothetical protein [Actinomycetes]ATY11227.1 hypothetical protein CU254_12685 [Amycolatopsis sp. AA4]EFL06814.1 predicted protein [Streptomyces sp. AA4]